jgi:hypothetical protein
MQRYLIWPAYRLPVTEQKTMTPAKQILVAAVAGFLLTPASPASAQSATAASSDAWTWRLAVNGWFPSIHSSTSFNLPDGGTISAQTDPSNYLSKLEFVFMGTLEARRGPWSFLADTVYLSLGDLRSKVRSVTGPGGSATASIGSDASTDLKGFIGTFEGGYTFVQTPQQHVDVMTGLRYARLKTALDWSLGSPTGGHAATGSVAATKDLIDGVVGVRGRASIGGNWDFRYYVDAGAGSSRFTYQAVAGLGYQFNWGDVVVGYRHLAYAVRSDKPISDISFSGPQIALGFKF